MDGFKAFKYFQAIRLHFTKENFDVFETGAAIKGSRAVFEERNDKLLYERLARKFDTDQELIQFIVSNIAYGHVNVVYSTESDELYNRWVKRKQAITQCFREELDLILDHMRKNKLSGDKLFSIDNCSPELLNLYIGGYVSLETMVILRSFNDYLIEWEPLIMLWSNHFLIIRKANRFVKFKRDRVQSIYDNFIHELDEMKS